MQLTTPILLTATSLVLAASSVSALAVPPFPLENGTFALAARHEGHASAPTAASIIIPTGSAVPSSGAGRVKRDDVMCANHTDMATARRAEGSPPYVFPNATVGIAARREGLSAPATLPALSAAPSSGAGRVKRDGVMCANHTTSSVTLVARHDIAASPTASASASTNMPKSSDAGGPPYALPNGTLALARRQEGLRAPATLPALSSRPTGAVDRVKRDGGMCANNTATAVVAEDTKTAALPTSNGMGYVAG